MTIRFSDITGGGIPYGDTAGRPANPTTGKLYSNGEAARLELYTADGWANIVQETPGVSSISGTYSEQTDSGTITISGTNFVSGCYATAVGSNGVQVDAASTTFNSLVQVVATFTGLSNAYEPYDIKVTNPSNLFGLLPDALYINASPVWTTSAGSLGSFNEQVSVSVSAVATDSDSTITYALANGSSLPSGLSLNSSTGAITGTLPDISSDTTYTFTINASDGLNIIPRSFSIASAPYPTGGTITTSGSYRIHTFTGNGTFLVPSSKSVEYLVVAGGAAGGSGLAGGGGAGGLRTNVGSPTTFAANSYTITVGGGGAPNATNMSYGGDGVNSSIIGGSVSISSTGGGSGGYYSTAVGKNGGSGGGGGGTGTQGQWNNGGSGNAGNYSPSEGNSGGRGTYWGNSRHLGGGGGGAGGNGYDTVDPSGGNGGAGLQSSITGTSTYYAGGGGGAGRNGNSASGGYGGSGIGGRGAGTNTGSAGGGEAGVTNTGSGGGGGDYQDGSTSPAGGAGGSGIVILRYLA